MGYDMANSDLGFPCQYRDDKITIHLIVGAKPFGTRDATLCGIPKINLSAIYNEKPFELKSFLEETHMKDVICHKCLDELRK